MSGKMVNGCGQSGSVHLAPFTLCVSAGGFVDVPLSALRSCHPFLAGRVFSS